MEKTDNATLQNIKRRAFLHGLDLMGLSTHQTFLSPDAEKRQKNIEHTINCLELAYAMGIGTMRVQSGTWGTSKDFDDLMAHRGIEDPLKGYSDEDGFKWVQESYEKILPTAEKCGVTMGFENHWGLGRTPEGTPVAGPARRLPPKLSRLLPSPCPSRKRRSSCPQNPFPMVTTPLPRL